MIEGTALGRKQRHPDNGEAPYLTFESGDWTWEVLVSWQKDETKPYGRWLCNVITPYVPNGEQGDTYVRDILVVAGATLILVDGEHPTMAQQKAVNDVRQAIANQPAPAF